MISKIQNKKILLVILVIFLLLVSSIFIFFITNTEKTNTENVNINETSNEISISLSDNTTAPVHIVNPNAEIIHELSTNEEIYTINKFSTNTEYGEYEVLNQNNNTIEKFIIEEPTGENIVNITVIDEMGDEIENADITISNITRTTSENGVATFYDVRLGHHMFKAESDGYETYNTTFEIISSEMNVTVTLNKK